MFFCGGIRDIATFLRPLCVLKSCERSTATPFRQSIWAFFELANCLLRRWFLYDFDFILACMVFNWALPHNLTGRLLTAGIYIWFPVLVAEFFVIALIGYPQDWE